MGGLPVLSGVFHPRFFEGVRKQIEDMERTDRVGPLHSMFIFLVKDDQIDSRRQTILLEDYLGKILSHPDVVSRPNIGNHIKAQLLSSDQHVFRLFEVSILGNLISQLPGDSVRLYPGTVGNRDVEARITLVDRPVDLETTVLNDSLADQQMYEAMFRTGRNPGVTSRDLDADAERFRRKVSEKGDQFLPSNPNALIVSIFGFHPLGFSIDKILSSETFSNIGLLMLFDRSNLTKTHEGCCDGSCALTSEERERLTALLSGGLYRPLAYNWQS